MAEPSNAVTARLAALEHRMTEVEKKLGEIEELRNLIRDIHRSLFDPPRPNSAALIDRVIHLVETAEKSRFASNMILRIVLTVGAGATAVTATLKLLGIF
jgi:hypothetical protein